MEGLFSANWYLRDNEGQKYNFPVDNSNRYVI